MSSNLLVESFTQLAENWVDCLWIIKISWFDLNRNFVNSLTWKKNEVQTKRLLTNTQKIHKPKKIRHFQFKLLYLIIEIIVHRMTWKIALPLRFTQMNRVHYFVSIGFMRLAQWNAIEHNDNVAWLWWPARVLSTVKVIVLMNRAHRYLYHSH